jgi:GAF domain-containing protein
VALEMVAQGAPLAEVLQFVVASLEKQATEGLMVSILLLDEDGKYVRLGAASGLPEGYCRSLEDGLPLSNLTGPCHVVVTEKRPAIVPDLAADPRWEAFGHLVAPHDFRAAWSSLIISSDQRLLGTLCICYRYPRTLGPIEQWMIEKVTRTVALAIEHKQAEAEREELLIREQAERTNRVKDEFLAVVSHDCD